MVKKNKLLIGCLALLLVLSVGYALFSEKITINGTATAKGSFNITTTCTPGYSDEFVNAGYVSSANEGQGGFANSICNVNGNTVTMTTDLLYPTANRYFTIKMTNTGSITASLLDDISANLESKVCYIHDDGSIATACEEWFPAGIGDDTTYKFYDTNLLAFSDKNNNICGSSEEAKDCMDFLDNTELTKFIIEPQESIYLYLYLYWPEEYATGGGEYASKSGSYQMNLSFDTNFEQYTVQ